MRQELYKDAFSEVVYLINNMRSENQAKISKKFIEFLEENKNNDYKPSNISLENPDSLKRETKIVLSLIYRDYFCEKKQEEKVINKIKSYEEMFDNQPEKIEKEIGEVKEDIELLDVSKISWYEKIINKVKEFINKVFKK